MSEGHIDFQISEHVARVILSNPQRRNAMSAAMWQQLKDYAIGLAGSTSLRAVVIRGAGDKAFSAGADITGFEDERSSVGTASAYDDLVESTCQAVQAISVPTVAMVSGACVGAGLSLAGSCDLMVASHQSFFAVPAANLGLGYDPRGVQRLVRGMGSKRACELLFTAQRIPASRLYETGGITRLAPASELESVCDQLVQEIVRCAPLTVAAAKLAIRAVVPTSDPALFALALTHCQQADASQDYSEGRKAFLEKRPPTFKGV